MSSADGSSITCPLTSHEIEVTNYHMIEAAYLFGLYGVFVSLVVINVYTLARSNLKYAFYLNCLILFLFICETSGLTFTLVLLEYRSITFKLWIGVTSSLSIMNRTIFVICDVVIVWRAWILYPGNLSVKMLLAFLSFTLVLVPINGIFGMLIMLGNTHLYSSGAQTLILTVPMFVTNFVATSLIIYKVWPYRHSPEMQFPNKRERIEFFLALLLESGPMHIIIWIIALGFFLRQVLASNGYQAMYGLCPLLGCINSAGIVLLIANGKSPLEAIFFKDSSSVMTRTPSSDNSNTQIQTIKTSESDKITKENVANNV